VLALRESRPAGAEFALDTGLFRDALDNGRLRVLAVALPAIGAMVQGRERDLATFLAQAMRPCAGERILLTCRQHLLNESTQSDTYGRSCP